MGQVNRILKKILALFIQESGFFEHLSETRIY